jgi:hypothetical protein
VTGGRGATFLPLVLSVGLSLIYVKNFVPLRSDDSNVSELWSGCLFSVEI